MPLSVALILSGVLFFEIRRQDYVYSAQNLAYWKPLIRQAMREHDYTVAGLRRPMPCEEELFQNPWRRETAENGQTIWHTGFEYRMEDFTPSNVVRSRSFEGRYICKTDSLQPFGINFEDTIRVSTAYPPLIVVKWKMLRENTLKCLLVTELWEAGKLYTSPKSLPNASIVSLYKPCLRPFVRSKENKSVEFGAKVNMLQVGGAIL